MCGRIDWVYDALRDSDTAISVCAIEALVGDLEMIDQVTEFVWRGSRPGSYRELKELGFVRVIDLESGVYDEFHRDELNGENPGDFGIKVYHVPCSDVFPPSMWQVCQVLGVLATGSGTEKTLIHCLSGVDRTGFMSAVLRMKVLHWSYARAVEEFRVGRHWWFWWWDLYLKKYE